jgi:hypothetical protein
LSASCKHSLCKQTYSLEIPQTRTDELPR